MDDLISRQAAIDALERAQSLVENPITETRWFDFGLRKAQEILSELPSAGAVPVVRCRECKYHTEEQPGIVYCHNIVGGWVEEDWFCKGGERQ